MGDIYSRWGCKIEGEKANLSFLQEIVNGSIRHSNDFFISTVGANFLLLTSVWDKEDSYQVVAIRAESDLKILEGLVSLYIHTNPFKCGTIAEFGSDGTIIDRQLNGYFKITGRIKTI